MSRIPVDSQKIAKLRKVLSLSQAEFGHVLNTTRETISRWENGYVQPPAKQRFAIEVLERLVHQLSLKTREDEEPGSRGH